MDSRLPATSSRLWAVIVVLGVSALAIVIAQFAVLPAFVLDRSVLADPTQASRAARTTLLVFNFVGLALGGAAYLWVTGRGWTWIDLHLPNVRDLLWMVLGIVLLLVFYVLVGVFSLVLDLPAADSSVVLFLQDDVTMVLIMIGIVLLFNAPAEEFLFRNVVQKRLYEDFSGMGAVLVASLIFVIVHIPMFLTLAESPVATGVSLTVMFGGSMIFGYIYLRTENLLVPTVVHALYNALVLLLVLATIVYDLDPDGQAVGAFVALAFGGA